MAGFFQSLFNISDEEVKEKGGLRAVLNDKMEKRMEEITKTNEIKKAERAEKNRIWREDYEQREKREKEISRDLIESQKLIELYRIKGELEKEKAKVRLYEEMNTKNITDSEALLLSLGVPIKIAGDSKELFSLSDNGISTESSSNHSSEFANVESVLKYRSDAKSREVDILEKLKAIEERDVEIRQKIAKAEQEEIKTETQRFEQKIKAERRPSKDAKE